jgi:hypothetical protein
MTDNRQGLTAVFRNAGIYSSKSHQVVWRSEFCVIHPSNEIRAAQSRETLWATNDDHYQLRQSKVE